MLQQAVDQDIRGELHVQALIITTFGLGHLQRYFKGSVGRNAEQHVDRNLIVILVRATRTLGDNPSKTILFQSNNTKYISLHCFNEAFYISLFCFRPLYEKEILCGT
ncbi:hypothetical protein ACJX0J_028339 [Zea mays]